MERAFVSRKVKRAQKLLRAARKEKKGNLAVRVSLITQALEEVTAAHYNTESLWKGKK